MEGRTATAAAATSRAAAKQEMAAAAAAAATAAAAAGVETGQWLGHQAAAAGLATATTLMMGTGDGRVNNAAAYRSGAGTLLSGLRPQWTE
jgi:hypothetical protein